MVSLSWCFLHSYCTCHQYTTFFLLVYTISILYSIVYSFVLASAWCTPVNSKVVDHLHSLTLPLVEMAQADSKTDAQAEPLFPVYPDPADISPEPTLEKGKKKN